MHVQLWRLLRDDDAATAVEYAVMLALIIGVVITAIGSVGSQTGGMWGNIQASVNAVGFGS
ncbi:MAG: Flp family type IVb pilin [Pirellulales bacterium]|nr:Flp family type IVb pilin [Pirellulales bacterium]